MAIQDGFQDQGQGQDQSTARLIKGLVEDATLLGLVGQRRLAHSKVTPDRARTELRETATELRKEIRWARPRRQPPVKSS